ncbi:hypothetical protein [Burkholderia phage FLC9]|nr:hypothetical protein [Burkholderia phage FLC9]
MATKAIVKLLKTALKGTNKEEVINLVGIPADEFDLLVDGSMEFSPLLAKKFGEALNIEPRTILAAQADDQLNSLGAVAKPIEQVAVQAEAKKATGTDGRPSQSPMFRDTGMVKLTAKGGRSIGLKFPSGTTDEQANKTMRAVVASFAD